MFLRILQFTWLLPATILVWIFYILPMWLIFRDLVFCGWPEFCIAEFKLAEKNLEPWFAKAWRDWGGWAGPCVYIYRPYDNEKQVEATKKHELKHCYQQFIWGVFHYPAYFLESVFIWLFQKAKHAYFDNHFEVEARRFAGQQIFIPRSQWPQGPGDRWIFW